MQIYSRVIFISPVSVSISHLPPFVDLGTSILPVSLLTMNIFSESVKRSFRIRTDCDAFQMSGSKSRLGNRSYAKGGLTRTVADYIEKCEKDAQAARHQPIRPLNQDVFFKPDYADKPRNPLLVVYPVQLMYEPKQGEDFCVV